ncbi:MaoC/PaaZ C-terminal domain-containing protein [Flavisphingomonas formosensis]|uniref:MaoC/PaaZ C-terminal domain-containing protein n=1 Tax=Flavisphingomonas formosensis TaxID=861534 RepID=UPI001E4125A5|nr:MaoC/PaaZ C-terminal domain-containing protein [Sphingomonas formosensis]
MTAHADESGFDAPPALSFDAIAPGSRFRIGAVTVSREAVIAFASEWDPQPFHLSDQGGAANPLFGRLAASGWHTVLLMQLEVDRFMRGTGLIGLAGGGVDEIRWIRPVFPPERLTIFVEFAAARASRSRPERGILTLRNDAYDRAGGHVARVSITAFFARKGANAASADRIA